MNALATLISKPFTKSALSQGHHGKRCILQESALSHRDHYCASVFTVTATHEPHDAARCRSDGQQSLSRNGCCCRMSSENGLPQLSQSSFLMALWHFGVITKVRRRKLLVMASVFAPFAGCSFYSN